MTIKKAFEKEKELTPMNGLIMLLILIVILLGSIALFCFGLIGFDEGGSAIIATIACIIFTVACIGFAGLKVINPNEALVLALFGNYYGTLKKPGFFYVNPFCSAINPAAKGAKEAAVKAEELVQVNLNAPGNKKVSLKTMTLNNHKQKVNDLLGNPIEIGTVVIFHIENATQAVLNVENYPEYLSIQCDAITRNAARCYPYDAAEDSDEFSLRGSSQEVAEIMKSELQEKVQHAGIMIQEVRITHLSYAPEIASAMLQRQQAAAIIDARQKIVEGAVGMVDMALEKLSENDIVELDEERKAAMVSNLLVVLCGNKDAQPIVNSGSLY